ncbi:MAG: hypothetical protein NTW19_08800 [Planctomycetota bacterium]|nr:hypothetical protein [Planctomycetota bacterium]
MSRQGLLVALQYGKKLPQFPGLREARRAFFLLRDQGIRELVAELKPEVRLDYSPDSLLALERWYFEHRRPKATGTGFPITLGIGFYFGKMLCRHAEYKWYVEEFDFAPGRYEMGVTKGYGSIVVGNGIEPRKINNKRMQSLFKRYCSYARW